MSDAASLADGLVRRFAEARPLRAGSFIVTVFGDAIVPRGGELALASLIRLVEPFGISETLVRTAVSRLSQEGWLESTKRGRRSFYRLSSRGTERFADATRRIYRADPPPWDGQLTLVVIPPDAADIREAVRRELRWAGFGALAPNVLFHPAPDREAMGHAIRSAEAADRVLVLDAPARAGSDTLRALAAQGWALDTLGDRYRGFSAAFAPVAAALGQDRALAPEAALSLRLLLIHEFRKAVLRDPLLPRAFLPPAWPGLDAHALAARLYRRIAPQAERALDLLGETAGGPLPAAEPGFGTRFAPAD